MRANTGFAPNMEPVPFALDACAVNAPHTKVPGNAAPPG